VVKLNRRLRKPSSHTRLLSRVIVLDVIWGGLSPLAAFLLRDGTINSPDGVSIYCGVSFLVSLLVFQWFRTSSPIARFYSIRDAWELLKACLLIAALSAVSAFVLTRLSEAPRSIPILHFMLLASGLLGVRVLLRLRETRRETRGTSPTKKIEHVIIIEASRLAWFFSKMIEELAPGGYQIVAILDERPKLKHRSLNGYPIIGAPADLEKVIADYAMHGVHIDKVVVATQPEDLSLIAWEEIGRVCRTLNIELEVLPERLMSQQAATGEDVVITPKLAEAAVDSPNELQLDRPFWKIKRAIDIVVALAAAILLSPVIVIVSACVLFDIGIPIVFWQRRVGRDGAPLHLYKFRTLHTLFDRTTKRRREVQEPSPIGRFLQRTRLDELPQLWNVLSGNMSLIGPRPLLPVDQPNDFTIRLTVRPGLTGWAQVCGGKSISVEEKTALDEWYIRHASLSLDLTIVLQTIGMLLNGDRRSEKAIATALLERSCGHSNLRDPRGAQATAAPGAISESDAQESDLEEQPISRIEQARAVGT
jgi:lipopolysaccharide/colanic/teichoic acid biosynthesis glycosyltransferase